MGIFELFFKARLDGIKKIILLEDMRWYFKIACSNCGEENDREIYLHANEEFEHEGTRGTFNFAMKCKLCSKNMKMNLLNKLIVKYKNSESFQKIAQVDARGAKVLAWRATRGINAVCESGTIFEDINIEEADWVEYDEQAARLVGIYEITTGIDIN